MKNGAPGHQQQWKAVSSHRNRRTRGRNGVTGVHRELELQRSSSWEERCIGDQVLINRGKGGEMHSFLHLTTLSHSMGPTGWFSANASQQGSQCKAVVRNQPSKAQIKQRRVEHSLRRQKEASMLCFSLVRWSQPSPSKPSPDTVHDSMPSQRPPPRLVANL